MGSEGGEGKNSAKSLYLVTFFFISYMVTFFLLHGEGFEVDGGGGEAQDEAGA